jgi:hypothetical protein
MKREVSHVRDEVSMAISRITTATPPLSRSAVVATLLEESPRIIAEIAKVTKKARTS